MRGCGWYGGGGGRSSPKRSSWPRPATSTFTPPATPGDDFAKEELSAQGLFIHEMTHVWQAQKCGRFYLPLMRHPFCRYSYEIRDGQPFHRYGLEQQAEIMRHIFLAKQGIEVANATMLVALGKQLPFGTA